MTWNYRIIKYKDEGGFGLHEVYYNENGKPTAMTMNPCSFAFDNDESENTVIKALCMALIDAIKSPVLDEKEIG